ncbi:MAG: NAD(+) diphosphatase [Micrococcales bacterium]
MNQPLHLPLAQSAIDRDYLTRENPNLFEELWANDSTRLLPIHRAKVLLNGQALRLLEVGQVNQPELLVYLGKSTEPTKDVPVGTQLVLAVLTDENADAIEPDESKWQVLRRSGFGLSALDAGMYAQALAMANWHQAHKYCSRCGGATHSEKAGWTRRCELDGKEIYPRTDPAVIVSIIDDQDRILLGSQGVWEENRWSVLAGYVEAGESLEASVEREMFEEAGVRVTEIKYLGSQGWPYPYSIMMAFSARVRGDQKQVADGIEIAKLRWFSREDIRNEKDSMLLPGPLTIARAMIENWYGSPLEVASQ